MEDSLKITSTIDLEQFNFGHSYHFNEFKHKKQVNNETIVNYYDINIVECQWLGSPGVMIVLTDVTHKMQCRMMEEAQQYKEQMLAQITHDLRTPLNGIICQLQSSCNYTSIEQYEYCVDLTLKSSYLLLSVINDILDHSQMMKGKLRLIPQNFNLKDLLNDVVELLKPQAAKKNIDLSWEYEDDIQLISNLEQLQSKDYDLFIYNDQNRIQQILLNLVGNALKYTFEGSIKIVVQQGSSSQNSLDSFNIPCYRISVIDTGVGIPESLQDKIFQIYGTYDHSQGNNKYEPSIDLKQCSQNSPSEIQKTNDISNLDQFYNTFMGSEEEFNERQRSDSPISFLVESKIIGRSQKKKPSQIRHKYLTRVLDQESSDKIRPKNFSSFIDKTTVIKNQIQKLLPKDQIKILIVDDNSFNILGIENLLKHLENIKFEYAFNGKEAVEKVSINYQSCISERYWLIFMDVNMPIMDGNQSIQIIRQKYQDKNPYKIISLTAFSQQEDKQKCLDSGADYFMNKPVTYQNIITMLQDINIQPLKI